MPLEEEMKYDPDFWANLFVYIILVTGGVNSVIYFFKALFLLAIFFYFRYWGGLEEVEYEEDEETGGRSASINSLKKMNTIQIRDKIDDQIQKKSKSIVNESDTLEIITESDDENTANTSKKSQKHSYEEIDEERFDQIY